MLIKSKANISKGKATLCWVKTLKKQSYNNIAKKKKKILQFALNYFRQQMFQIEILQFFDVGPPSVIPLDFQH